jgi:hypothetical protein
MVLVFLSIGDWAGTNCTRNPFHQQDPEINQNPQPPQEKSLFISL